MHPNRSLLCLALAAAPACGKKSDDKAGPPATKTAAGGPAAPAAPKLASTVKLAVDPTAFGDSKPSLEFFGPAIIHANKQNDGQWSYDVVFYPAGATATCETRLGEIKELQGGTALDISVNEFVADAPKPGLELAGKFEVHFMNGKHHTNGGLIEGAKIKLTGVTATTATGELVGETDSTRISGGGGTFTAQLCTWGDDPEPAADGSGSDANP